MLGRLFVDNFLIKIFWGAWEYCTLVRTFPRDVALIVRETAEKCGGIKTPNKREDAEMLTEPGRVIYGVRDLQAR